MRSPSLQFFIGTILSPRNDRVCDFLPRGVLVVGPGRSGAKIRDCLPYAAARKKYAKRWSSKNTVDFGDAVVIPGFFDMHFHWVQDDVRLLPKDSLLEWLEKYTFPAEAKFASRAYSRRKAREFFRRLTRTGTLGGAVFSSVHENAVEDAFREARGDFVIGNVQMNQNSPRALTQTEEESLAGMRRLFRKYGRRYAFTPRFAISTAPRVMKEGGREADRRKAFKQSHLSETPAEIDWTIGLYRKIPGFQKVGSYTEIYRKTAMLGPRSLMAHGIHLTEPELDLIRKSRTCLIHCPTSNAPVSERGLGSGLFDFRKITKKGIRWALGSDIGGGPVLSMWDVMRSFVDQNEKAGRVGATRICALYRATLAGAEILGLGRKTGNFTPGKDASFLVVPLPGAADEESAERLLARLIDTHSSRRDRYDECVAQVWLRGEKIWPVQRRTGQ